MAVASIEDDPPVVSSGLPRRASALTFTRHAADSADTSTLSCAATTTSEAATLHEEGDTDAAQRNASLARAAPAHDASESDSDAAAFPAVRRTMTSKSIAQPPYTIHSERMRWFIVGLVSLAGLFSCVKRAETLAECPFIANFATQRPLNANIYFPVIPAIGACS